jgi:hypothetical protein
VESRRGRKPIDAPDTGKFFRAFVSYSHSDSTAARRLQRQLETDRVPKRFVDRVPELGQPRGRIGPIFRDREDLPASGDLSEAVKEAIARSSALVVLCSPDAARSRWVAQEIELFRTMYPRRPILAALLRGEPNVAFPPALLSEGAEPAAADFRRGVGDGQRLAFLKIVAGILAVPLDELIQRDAQRRHRRVTAVTFAALAAMLVLAGMTIMAINARNEAQRQRAEAEGLVEFMLTDLRQRLKGVGRLDVMGEVNERAIRYYEDQPTGSLPDGSLEREARIIGAMGEDAENKGDLKSAEQRYQTLYRATAALLAKRPRRSGAGVRARRQREPPRPD